MPFISNELNEKLDYSNIKLEWPCPDAQDQNIIENFNHINELITKVRNFKKANNIPFKESIKLYFDNTDDNMLEAWPISITQFKSFSNELVINSTSTVYVAPCKACAGPNSLPLNECAIIKESLIPNEYSLKIEITDN